MADTRKRAAKTAKSYEGFTDEERAAMKEHAEEMKATASRGRGAKADADAESAMLRRSPRCRTRIVRWPSGSTPSSRPAHRL